MIISYDHTPKCPICRHHVLNNNFFQGKEYISMALQDEYGCIEIRHFIFDHSSNGLTCSDCNHTFNTN